MPSSCSAWGGWVWLRGSQCWGRETSGAAAGTAGGARGGQRGPSHLRALTRSLLRPWKSSLLWLKPRKHLALHHRHPGWKTASGKHNQPSPPANWDNESAETAGWAPARSPLRTRRLWLLSTGWHRRSLTLSSCCPRPLCSAGDKFCGFLCRDYRPCCTSKVFCFKS